MPESLLSEHEATIARNCDFAYGELRNTKTGFAFATLTNQPKSIYTDEGLTFYSWPTDVNAVRSPIVNDTFNRLYFTGDGAMKVTNRLATRTNGGPPSSSYLVGVPRPTVKPTLTVPEIPPINDTTANLAWTFHYESGGIKYQEVKQTIYASALGGVTAVAGQLFAIAKVSLTQWQFIPPEMATTTPATAKPVIRLTATWKTDSTAACDIYSSNSTFSTTAAPYTLDIQKDTTGSTYTVTMTAGIAEADKETRAYIYTYANTYNEEGPPSDPELVTTSTAVGCTVTVTKNSAGGYAPIKEIRIYRTPTGATIADYYYVGSIEVLGQSGSTFTFTDDVQAEQLNEPLSSLNYYPPDPALVGLMALPNGILCAWKNNELHFSEAYKPWAWPPAYVKPLEHNVVGGTVHGSGAIVTTRGRPYAVSGVSPDSMTTTKLNVDQAGVSKRSIGVVDGVVVYASNDGLVTLNGAVASLIPSQRFFTREVWRQRYSAGLSDMIFGVWDGRLVVFSPSASFVPFMIRTDEADGTMTDLPSFVAKCAFTNVMSDQMYYTNNNILYQFNGGDNLASEWQSRELVIQRPVNFGAAQAIVEGNWTIELWAYVQRPDGSYAYSLRHTENISGTTKNFRLPSGYESDRYRVHIAGSGRFRELRIAQTFRELSVL